MTIVNAVEEAAKEVKDSSIPYRRTLKCEDF